MSMSVSSQINNFKFTRMAAAVVNGCVDSDYNSLESVKKCVGKEEKLQNGKVNNHKNGFVKSTHVANGLSVSVCILFYNLRKQSVAGIFL